MVGWLAGWLAGRLVDLLRVGVDGLAGWWIGGLMGWCFGGFVRLMGCLTSWGQAAYSQTPLFASKMQEFPQSLRAFVGSTDQAQ